MTLDKGGAILCILMTSVADFRQQKWNMKSELLLLVTGTIVPMILLICISNSDLRTSFTVPTCSSLLLFSQHRVMGFVMELCYGLILSKRGYNHTMFQSF